MIHQKGNFSLTNWELVSVNPNEKNWTWKDIFCFWGNNIQTLIGFSLIASIFLVYNINFLIVVAGFLISSILVYIFVNLIGKPSQKHGLPFSVMLRTSMGVNGARYISLLRGLVGIFMFGVQTYFISKSIGYLIRVLLFTIDKNIIDQEFLLFFFMGMDVIDLFSFLVALLIQYSLFSNGISANRKFINFSALFVYFGLFLFFIIIVSENFNEISNSIKIHLNFNNALSKSNIIPLLAVTSTLFAYFSIIIVNFGDFSRYVKNENELKKGNLTLLLNLILFSFLSIIIVLGVDIIFAKKQIEINQLLTNPTDIIGKFDNTFLTIVALIFILFSSSSTNLIANYIPTQNVLINFFPSNLSLKSSGFLIILFGFFIGLFWLPILSKIGILSFIDTIGAFFGPIFGIMIADYYLIQNKKIINKDIFSSMPDSSYYYSNGWQIKGLYSLIVGFIFSSSTIWNTQFLFLQSYSWLIGAIISFVVYYLLKSD